MSKPSALYSLIAALILLAGCESGPSYRVTFVTQPDQASLSLTRGGETRFSDKPVGYETRLSFPEDGTSYELTLTPTGEAKENYVVTTRSIRLADEPCQ